MTQEEIIKEIQVIIRRCSTKKEIELHLNSLIDLITKLDHYPYTGMFVNYKNQDYKLVKMSATAILQSINDNNIIEITEKELSQLDSWYPNDKQYENR